MNHNRIGNLYSTIFTETDIKRFFNHRTMVMRNFYRGLRANVSLFLLLYLQLHGFFCKSWETNQANK